MKGLKQIQQQIEHINFEDAQIKHAEVKNGEVLVTVENWQTKLFRFRFKGVVYFKSFEFGSDLSKLQLSDDTEEIREAMRVIINDGGSIEGYAGLIQASFVSDTPVMIVVFQEFTNES
ncbi:MAG TPA: hypothetical protein VF627_16105 [Abditibacterium sp.]